MKNPIGDRTCVLVTGEWISVKDRLPEEADYGEHEDVIVLYRYTDDPSRPWEIGESRMDELDPDTNGGWLFGSCDYAEVSHWMRKDHLMVEA